jgi:hypothetical protein
MQWTDNELQIHSILFHTMVHLCGEKNLAQAEWTATPAVLVYRLRNLVLSPQLDLVTFGYRLHRQSRIA